MRTKSILVACAALLSCSAITSHTTAQETLKPLVGTLNITPKPYFAAGTLVGCTLVYAAVHEDWIYRQGALIKVDGNLGVMYSASKLATTLKVVVNEVHFEGTKINFTPSPPTRAYLVGPALDTNLASLVSTANSDTPGALFSVFQLSPTFEMLVQGLENNQLIIAFNNLGGGSDINMPLELDVVDVKPNGERIRSAKIKTDFLSCLDALAKTVQ